jgi:hypothetical protein
MTGIYIALVIAFLLLALLLIVWRSTSQATRELRPDSDLGSGHTGQELEICPPEFVAQIFSPDDWHFVEGVESPLVAQLFRRERKAVALLWVQQTLAGIAQIMREHVEAARGSHDVEFASEAKIFLQHAQLQFACGILYLCIELAGPQGLRGVAVYTDALSRRIAEAGQSLKAATSEREIQSAGSL